MTINDREFVIRTIVDYLQKYLKHEFPKPETITTVRNLDIFKQACLEFMDILILMGLSMTKTYKGSKTRLSSGLGLNDEEFRDVLYYLKKEEMIDYKLKKNSDQITIELIEHPDRIYNRIVEW